MPGLGNILSKYIQNYPSAEVVLVDVNGFYWIGSVSDGGGVQLFPVNPFTNNPLWNENTSEISVARKKQATPISFPVPLTHPHVSLANVDIKLLSHLNHEE